MGRQEKRAKDRKEQKLATGNPFNDPKRAIDALCEVYPNIPKPVLLRAFCIYDQTRRMSEKDRREVNKMLNDMPDVARVCDFDDDSFPLEYSCVEAFNEGEYEPREDTEDYLMEVVPVVPERTASTDDEHPLTITREESCNAEIGIEEPDCNSDADTV